MTAKLGRWLGGLVIVAAYLLTLLTQLPHVQSVYQAMEKENHTIFGLALSTAWGAAIAFEISVAIFTWRLIVNRSSTRSKWTKRGVVGFLLLSFVANLSYYFDFVVGPVSLDAHIMPFLLAAALPLALWLYAEEFGASAGAAVKKSERAHRKEVKAKEAEILDYDVKPFLCWCGGWEPAERHQTQAQARGGLGAHTRKHRQEAREILAGDGVTTGNVRIFFEETYGEQRAGKELPDLPQAWEIGEWS